MKALFSAKNDHFKNEVENGFFDFLSEISTFMMSLVPDLAVFEVSEV